MSNWLSNSWKGFGKSIDFGKWAVKVSNCLNGYTFGDGWQASFDEAGLRLTLDATSLAKFSGRVFVAGQKITVTQTTGYILVKFDGSGYTWSATHDMATAMPEDGEWYDLSKTYGDIHIPRVST